MTKIVIIKLGALGDVVRTTPLLLGIKEKYPDANITWITKPESQEILENNSQINKILTIPISDEQINEYFDVLINLDIEDEATNLASRIESKNKFGFYSEEGFPAPFNSGAEYYLETVFSDELKKINKKTYQQMMFEAADLEYKKQPCFIYLSESDKSYAQDFFNKYYNLSKNKLVGINVGSSSRWPSKSWSEGKIIEFITKLKQQGYEVLLLGGNNEEEKIHRIKSVLLEKNIDVPSNDKNTTIKQFASLINLCEIIVCGDTMALHLALALNKQTIGLFFCTSPDEIEDYGLLLKIASPKLKEFFPENSDKYSEELVNSISVEEVLDKIDSFF
ncbi:MAG TPA: glycosyltransferase family 9 protein [Candidatus Paceibacterota bacterium]|nr:glycosyltransferase family 9 protein [Candidatus Paceibacterota bacterium]